MDLSSKFIQCFIEIAGIDLKNQNIELLDIACGQGGGASFLQRLL